MNAPVPDPREQVLRRFRKLAQDWLEDHDEPDRAPEQAGALLAAWAGLSRVIETTSWPADLADLAAQLREDKSAIMRAFLEGSPPIEWLEDAADLDRARGDLTSNEERRRELDSASVALFDRLDALELAVYQAQRLCARDMVDALQQLTEWKQQLKEAEEYLADSTHVFLPAEPIASVWQSAFLPDLDETDFELWETTLKHRRLEELQEELNAL